jgi:cephalosporin hydroxylase
MRMTIDTDAATLDCDGRELGLMTPEGFEALSRLWTTVGWQQKYSYRFSWLGRPIIQLPEDIVRVQEAICEIRPDRVIETGIAHGGSLVLYASVLRALGDGGRVIGIDVEIRPHNLAALQAHELIGDIDLVVGSSTDPATVARVGELADGAERVMVLLDSNHTRAHVAAELEAYAGLVTPGSYLLVADGIMREVAGGPRGKPEWEHDNPIVAIDDFLAGHPEFERVAPPRPFDESEARWDPTHWPEGWLRRRAD